MFRLFLALNILLLNLFACKGGYDSCIKKIDDSKAVLSQTLEIPIPNGRKLIYSRVTPNYEIIKYDPFLSLYLVKAKTKFKYPFKINNHLSLGIASVNKKMAIEGKIINRHVGLNSFASFSEPLTTPAILLNSCCALEGIVTPDGIIEKKYIERFLSNSSVSYGDIGIRVKQKKGSIFITAINPFIKDNPFKIGDHILAFDSLKTKDASLFMKKVLFSKIGSTHRVKIRRDGKVLVFEVKVLKRLGGGYLSDTFLEFLGLSFNKDLYITSIKPKAYKYALLVGDKLLQINQKPISNKKDMIKQLSQVKDSTKLLFSRDSFQFFIRIN